MCSFKNILKVILLRTHNKLLKHNERVMKQPFLPLHHDYSYCLVNLVYPLEQCLDFAQHFVAKAKVGVYDKISISSFSLLPNPKNKYFSKYNLKS